MLFFGRRKTKERRSGEDRRGSRVEFSLSDSVDRPTTKDRRESIDRRSGQDRRRYTRYRVRAGTFAVINNYQRKQRQIVDISMGGLCFNYMYREKASDEESDLDIVTFDNAFSLERLPFETVWDSKNSLKKQRGVEFGDLTYSQDSQLEQFINEYALSES